MGYSKLNLKNGQKLNQTHLAHIEDGIAATEAELAKKALKTDIPDVSGLQPKGDYALKKDIPSTSGFATEEFVVNKILEAELADKDVDLSGYYTKSEVDNKIAEIEHPTTDLSGYVTDEELLEAIGGIQVPSIEGLASEEYVDEAIAGIEHPVVDLTDYAKKDEVPSIEGLASETYVDNAVDNIVHPSIDLSGFATKSFVQNAIKSIAPEDLGANFMIPNPVDKSYYAGKKIACIGDSVTAGVGANGNPYVTQLGAALGATTVNLGASGTVLCTGGHRSCNIGKLTEGSLGGADIVTILMGINDWDQAKDGYYTLGNIDSTDTSTLYGAIKMWCDRIVELKKTASLAHTKFYFMTPLQTSWNNSKGGHNWDQNKVNIHGFKLRDLCQAIIDVCALYEIPVIDLNLYSGIYYNSADDQTASALGGDGIHPNEAGHTKITEAIIRGLEQNAEYESIIDTMYYLLAFAAHELGTELSYPVSIKHKTENKEILITGITLPVNTLALDAGESYTLIPTLAPVDTTQTNIVWETSNANIASIREGVVTAIAEGSVTITCKSADNTNVFATVAVTVNAAASTDLTALILSDETITVNAGESHTMSVAFVPAATAQTDVTWSCDDENVAEIRPSNDGKTCVVTAKNVGQCYITVTSNANSAIADSCLFTTSEIGEEEPDEPVPVSLFTLSPEAVYDEETGLLSGGRYADNTGLAIYNEPLKPGMMIEAQLNRSTSSNEFVTWGVDKTKDLNEVVRAQGRYATGLFNIYYDNPAAWADVFSLTSGTTTKSTLVANQNRTNPKIAVIKRDFDGKLSGSVNGIEFKAPINAGVTEAEATEDLYVFFGGVKTDSWKINYFGPIDDEPVIPEPEDPEEPDVPVTPEEPEIESQYRIKLNQTATFDAETNVLGGTVTKQAHLLDGDVSIALIDEPVANGDEIEVTLFSNKGSELSKAAAANWSFTIAGLTRAEEIADIANGGSYAFPRGDANAYLDSPSSGTQNGAVQFLAPGSGLTKYNMGINWPIDKGLTEVPVIFRKNIDGSISIKVADSEWANYSEHSGASKVAAYVAATEANELRFFITGLGGTKARIEYIGKIRE